MAPLYSKGMGQGVEDQGEGNPGCLGLVCGVMVPPPPPLPEPSPPSGPLKRSPASVPSAQAKRDPSTPAPVPPAGEGSKDDPNKTQGGRVGGPPTELACRSCLGVSFMTSAMRKNGRNSACYGLRRSVEMPQLPEVRDEYIEEVLRSRASWTYVCVGASEAIEAADPNDAALTPGFSPPLPTCRGLLVFMDGEEDDSDTMPHPTTTQDKPAPTPGSGKPAVPLPPRGEAAPTPLNSTRQPEQPNQGINNNASPDPSDPLRRVADFWSRAADNYGEKYARSAQRLVGAMDKQARHVVVFTKRLLTGRGSDDEGGHDQNPPGPPRPK